MVYGYIYIRIHTSYDKYNVCKLGKTINLNERNSMYKTSEVEPGLFDLVIKVSESILDNIEKSLHLYFKKYHYYKNGGTEFYKKDIMQFIIPYLKTLNIEFDVLTPEQIELITWKHYISNNEYITPNDHQLSVLLKIKEFYRNNTIGRILWGRY